MAQKPQLEEPGQARVELWQEPAVGLGGPRLFDGSKASSENLVKLELSYSRSQTGKISVVRWLGSRLGKPGQARVDDAGCSVC
jgi:hypothetical protein